MHVTQIKHTHPAPEDHSPSILPTASPLSPGIIQASCLTALHPLEYSIPSVHFLEFGRSHSLSHPSRLSCGPVDRQRHIWKCQRLTLVIFVFPVFLNLSGSSNPCVFDIHPPPAVGLVLNRVTACDLSTVNAVGWQIKNLHANGVSTAALDRNSGESHESQILVLMETQSNDRIISTNTIFSKKMPQRTFPPE